MALDMRIEGLDELLRRVKDPEVMAGPAREYLTRSAQAVETRGRQNSARGQTGNLQGRWGSEMDSAQMPQWAAVRNRAPHAHLLELGTKPHFVPAGRLAAWAAARGLNPYAVARTIAKKGTRPRWMLYRARKDSSSDFQALARDALDQIARRLAGER